MDDVELDNERHKREEQERRAKRKAHRSAKSGQTEKERKRKEHVQRILGAQQKSSTSRPSSSSKRTPSKKSSSSSSQSSSSSIFQSLFHQRAQGFLIDFHFRNAPPRPPVGPCFVGLGLDGELTDKWTKYKARNAVEKQYVWKLHAGNELYSGPLAISAMDYEGCYVDPERAATAASSTNVDGEDAIDEGGMMMNMDDDDTNNNPTKKQKSSSHIIPPLHPDDEAIINWKGSYGDTSAEQLQQKRDRARAAARLAIAQGYGSLSAAAMATPSSSSRLGGGKKSLSSSGGGTTTGSTVMKLKKKHHLQSRILDEKTPNFMKKTTYLTNDATSVHRFTSLASTQEKRAREVDKALAETAVRYKREDVIERGFVEANSWDVMMVNSNGGGVEVEEGEKRKKKRRVHPSKKGVYPVWDLPLLPDVPTWGHTYAHVVLDHPPKSVGTAPASGGGGGGTSATPSKNKNLVTARQLQKAIVADVSKQTQNSRMACTVWVPDTDDSASSTKNGKENEKKEGEENEETTKNVKKTGGDKGETYQAVQRYDLDVLPLRDPSGPQVHYVWMVDPSKNYVGYHPVGSRVQLSTGRPIIQAGGNNNKTQRHGGGGGEDEKLVTNESIIFRRAIEVDERKEMEKRMAEVDVDMAEKYGLVEDNELVEGGGGDKKEGGDGLEGKNNVDDGDDAEMEKDAF